MSRGLGDVYKRQPLYSGPSSVDLSLPTASVSASCFPTRQQENLTQLYAGFSSVDSIAAHRQCECQLCPNPVTRQLDIEHNFTLSTTLRWIQLCGFPLCPCQCGCELFPNPATRKLDTATTLNWTQFCQCCSSDSVSCLPTKWHENSTLNSSFTWNSVLHGTHLGMELNVNLDTVLSMLPMWLDFTLNTTLHWSDWTELELECSSVDAASVTRRLHTEHSFTQKWLKWTWTWMQFC